MVLLTICRMVINSHKLKCDSKAFHLKYKEIHPLMISQENLLEKCNYSPNVLFLSLVDKDVCIFYVMNRSHVLRIECTSLTALLAKSPELSIPFMNVIHQFED